MKGALGYGKCLAGVKENQSVRSKEQRVEWATRMLAEYLEKEHWRHIRFSDKIHLVADLFDFLVLVQQAEALGVPPHRCT